jgi:hemerythrin superfamily protein
MPTRTEKEATTSTGASAVKPTGQGLSGVFEQLAREHHAVKALLLRVKESPDVEVRRELFPRIRSELLSHEKAELKEVYPAFKQHAELEGMALAHDAEAEELEELIEELSGLAYDDGAWESRFAELVEVVLDHVEEEEGEYFPAATRLLGSAEADRLKARYERARAEAT